MSTFSIRVGNQGKVSTDGLPLVLCLPIECLIIKYFLSPPYPSVEGDQLYKNKPLRKSKRDDDDRGKGEMVIWAANDASIYTFVVNGQEMTVASYFETCHEIKLQYPCMPIIYVDNISKFGGGWFPIEFLYQSFAKSKDNSEEIVTNILKYHDAIAGKK
jgi:hypothetical protein